MPQAPGLVGFSQIRSDRTWNRNLRYLAFTWGMVFGLNCLVPSRILSRPTAPPNSAPATSEKQAKSAEQEKDFLIHGSVSDYDQRMKVLTGVKLSLFQAKGPAGAPEKIDETVSGDDGRYQFDPVVPPVPEGHLDRLSYALVAETEGGTKSVFYVYGKEEMNLLVRQLGTSLAGRVVNEDGMPIAGATVMRSDMDRRPIPGVHSSITDQQGAFFISDLRGVLPAESGEGITFWIHHPDYPVTQVRVKSLPAEVTFTLRPGCVLRGRALEEENGRPMPGVLITAIDHETRETTFAETNAEGQFRLVVPAGRYNCLAESQQRIATALADVVCAPRKTVELPEFRMTEGGYITGQVINTKTGKPLLSNQQGQPIALGLIGPSHPGGNGSRQLWLTKTDGEGRFRLRAMPGKNYPYLLNQHGSRMFWDTERQPPIIVMAGLEAEANVEYVPPRSPEEKMEEANAVLAKLPSDPEKRVVAILEEFRSLDHTVDQTETWCLLLHDLVQIGPKALPQLIAELDATTSPGMLRRLGFALRAIGDPRALPGLIRAIPKTLLPPSSDYSLAVEDGDLTAFMQKHDMDDRDGGTHFGYGRPVREVFGAIHKLSGKDFADKALYFSLSKDPWRESMQRQIYDKQARLWQKWWEDNWRDFTDDDTYSKVKLPMATFDVQVQNDIQLTPEAKIEGVYSGATVAPPGESGSHLMDLDTYLSPRWPWTILPAQSERVLAQIDQWADENGADLMCVTETQPDGKKTYALRGIGMRVWRLSDEERRTIREVVTEGKFPVGKPVADQVMRYDGPESEEAEKKVAYLFATREGGLGIITLTDIITTKRDITGQFFTPRGVGFYRGVKFDLQEIRR